ncbi:nucleotide exchange factor GrpE, partial [Candidatus Daviesbacteria bacterium]|nr:nucleotide exchange factor GrpE [Candidatus Daviesbacteria bacterium]
GLEEIKTEGEFNPALQEAVDTRAGDDNIILVVVRKGYTLNGKILRPAQVVVGKSESRIMNQESREEEEKI